MEHIPRLQPPGYELPDKIKAALGDGKYGQSVSNSFVPEVMTAWLRPCWLRNAESLNGGARTNSIFFFF